MAHGCFFVCLILRVQVKYTNGREILWYNVQVYVNKIKKEDKYVSKQLNRGEVCIEQLKKGRRTIMRKSLKTTVLLVTLAVTAPGVTQTANAEEFKFDSHTSI